MANSQARVAACVFLSLCVLTSVTAADDAKGSKELRDLVASLTCQDDAAALEEQIASPMSASPAASLSRSLSPEPPTVMKGDSLSEQLDDAFRALFGLDGVTQSWLAGRRGLRAVASAETEDAEAAVEKEYADWFLASMPRQWKGMEEWLKSIVVREDASSFAYEEAFLLALVYLKQAKAVDKYFRKAVALLGAIMERDVDREWLPATIAYQRLTGNDKVIVDGYCEKDITLLYDRIGVQTLAAEFERLMGTPFFPEVLFVPTGPAQ